MYVFCVVKVFTSQVACSRHGTDTSCQSSDVFCVVNVFTSQVTYSRHGTDTSCQRYDVNVNSEYPMMIRIQMNLILVESID